MDIKQDIEQMTARLRGAGIGVDAMLRRAKVDRATWQRWKAGATLPMMASWTRVKDAFADMVEEK